MAKKIKVNISGAAFTGKIVTFKAPCDCTEATGLVIGEDTYDVVDALGNCITGSYLAWRGGAVVSVALDVDSKKAFLQNEKPTPAAIGAAPAGYGYGEVLTLISGLDAGSEEALEAALEEQFNRLKVGEAMQIRFQPYPYVPAGIAGTTFVGTLFRHDTSYAVLHCTSYFGWGCSKTRWSTGWKPIEWVNPPMNLGVEYRTTERYLGKPVYVKLLDGGALPNNTTKYVDFIPKEELEFIVEYVPYIGSKRVMPYSPVSGSTNGVWFDTSSSTTHRVISVKTNYDASAYTFSALLKYTKTTD